MSNILTIAKYELKRLFRDWRLVIMVLSQPIVIALIVGLVANHEPRDIKVLVSNVHENKYSNELIAKLEAGDSLNVEMTSNFSNDDIKNNKARAIVQIDISEENIVQGSINIKTDPAGSLATIVAQQKISEAVSAVAREMAQDNVARYASDKSATIKANLPVAVPDDVLAFNIDEKSYDPLSVDVKDGTDMKIKYFDFYGSSMMVVLVLLVVLNLSGISITSERVSGTFERMTVTPYRKKDIILGKAMALFLVGLAVNWLGILSLKVIYDISLGNLYLLSLLTVLVVGMAVGLGLFVSSITKNVVESVEAAMYVFFVSFLACGLLLPLDSAHPIYAKLMLIFPFYHAVSASRHINMMGANWSQISNDAYIVAAWMVGFLVLAVISLRREAK